MGRRIAIDERGLYAVERDGAWQAEVACERLRALGDVERRSLWANIASFVVAAAGAAWLPNSDDFILPLAGRLIALLVARAAFRDLRQRIAEGQGTRGALVRLTAALALAGASCAPVLAPVLLEPFLHPARMVVSGAVLIGVALALSLFAPTPRLAVAYVGGFAGTFAAIMIPVQGWHGAGTVLALCALLSIVGFYGIATSLHQRAAAETLVENRRLSEELADSLAHAEFLAYRDPLTGLLNRRAFFQSAEIRGEGALPRHVLTIDLDHFKAINDRFGHAVGDRVLVAVSDALRAVTQQVEGGRHCAVRLGGEEFVVVLDVADGALAATVAEMIRHAITLVAREVGAPGLVTTASIGLAAWPPGHSIDAVLSRADAALYRAKARGRDRVIRAAA